MEEAFEYTYSAPEQEEIQRIRSKYLPPEKGEESVLERIRRLDRQAERPGTIASLVLGILGALVFGGGMSLCMVWGMLWTGVPVGLLGAALMGAAYPAYTGITRRRRERIAPEILRLTEQL